MPLDHCNPTCTTTGQAGNLTSLPRLFLVCAWLQCRAGWCAVRVWYLHVIYVPCREADRGRCRNTMLTTSCLLPLVSLTLASRCCRILPVIGFSSFFSGLPRIIRKTNTKQSPRQHQPALELPEVTSLTPLPMSGLSAVRPAHQTWQTWTQIPNKVLRRS